MIRNAACALLGRSTASATASLARATPAPQSTASSARGFHAAAAKSGQRRADTVLPSRRHGHSSAAKNSTENSRSIEEKKATLLQVLFKQEAAAGARKRVDQKLAELDTTGLLEEKRKLKAEMEALNEAMKAKTEDLLATIGRKGASGVDLETLMLARLAQAAQDIQDLKLSVTSLTFFGIVLGVVTGCVSIFK